MLGLWSRETVEPKSSGQTSTSEIAFTIVDAAIFETMHANWQRRGLTIAQAPTLTSFGTTFVAIEPNGHHLRVFAAPPHGR